MTKLNPIWQMTLMRLRLYYREPGALFWSFGFPILISLALGVAFRNRPPEPTRVAVVTSGGSAQDQATSVYAALMQAPEIKASITDDASARTQLRLGQIDIAVVPGVSVTYRYDSTRPEARLARAVVDARLQRAAGRADPQAVVDAVVSEPGARYIDFFVPGIIGVNIMSSGMWGIGYVIVETRTKKLLKRMLATPMRRAHFLLSFVFMRVLFALIELPVLLLFARFAFDVTVRGSWLLLVTVAMLGVLAFSGVGILVASRAQNTSTVTGLVNLVSMPMFVLSGVFFSSANFPDVMQPLIQALPLTALNDALRAIVNEGAALSAIAPRIGILVITAVVTFLVGLKVFRWS